MTGVFEGRSKSVLPPIDKQRNHTRKLSNTVTGRKQSAAQVAPGTLTPGRLLKLDQVDINSDTRSVYRLDPLAADADGPKGAAVPIRSKQGPHNLDSIMKSLSLAERVQLFDQIQRMRGKEEVDDSPS